MVRAASRLVNNLTNITVLANPANASANPIARAVESAGQKLSINVRTDFIRNASEIEAAISGAGRRSRGALIVLPDGLAVVQSAPRQRALISLRNEVVPALFWGKALESVGELENYADFSRS